MAAINIVAILGFVITLLCCNPISSLIREKGKEENSQDKSYLVLLWIIFGAAFVVRIIAAAVYKGNETDMNCFLIWSQNVFEDGLSKFYLSDSFHDYPPGYMYILYIVGAIRALFSWAWDSKASIVLTKLPAIIADMFTAYLIFKIASKRLKKSGAAFLSAVYLFCPMIILDSAVWGQTDSVFTVFMVLMCYLITEKKLIPSYFVFAIGILIKPQSLFFTPVLICGIIDQVFLEDFNWKKFFKNLVLGVAAILMIGVLMLPFGFSQALNQYTGTLKSYEYASINAYNFWNMLGLNWASQYDKLLGVQYKTWGTIAIVLTVIISIIISLRCKKNAGKYYFIGGFVVTTVFMFAVRMHERYLFPAMVMFLLAFAVRLRKEIYMLYILVSTVAFYNAAHVLFVYDNTNFNSKAPIPIAISIGLLLTVVFMFYAAAKLYFKPVDDSEEISDIMAQIEKKNQKMQGKMTNNNPIKKSAVLAKMTKKDFIALGIITLVYAVIAFARLGDMNAPKSEYSLVKQGAVTFDMGAEVNVAKLWDFLGYKNNPTYYIEYTNDVNGEWTTLCGQGSEWDAGSVFTWNQKDINVSARYFRISPSAENGEDSILELVFTDADGNLLEPVNAKEYKNLFDEQKLFTGRSTNLNGTYFDEIYHARTAYEMIHHLYCYENTHPPLGKAIMAVGILIFGMCPFGWRFMGTLFGVLMIPIIYNFAKKFFGETWICIVTTLLFTFDFMHFVQTRIATIDVFVTLFIMLSYYFMYCYTKLNFYDTPLKKTFIPLGLCGIAMGLSWASKWTGIYSSAGLCVIFFIQMYKRFREYQYANKNIDGSTDGISHKYISDNFVKMFMKTIGFCCIFFVVIPVIIYTLSYIPFSDGTDRTFITKVIEAQKTMFNYHSALSDTHPYSSKWYQWPIMYKPMWYYSGITADNLREGISAFGNPLVWWAGIPAFVYMLYLIYKDRDKKAIFLTLGYLSQYAPWLIVTRTVFIYHYFPSVPFVAVMLGYSFYKIVQKNPQRKKCVFVYTAAAIVLFAMFYPVLSGYPITISYANILKWFDSWVLVQTW